MAIAYVNGNSKYAGGIASTLAADALNCAAGNLIVVHVRTFTSATINSVTAVSYTHLTLPTNREV